MLVKMIFCPSGDHEAAKFDAPLLVICVWFEPSAFITKICISPR
jgi:hypothetical protein